MFCNKISNIKAANFFLFDSFYFFLIVFIALVHYNNTIGKLLYTEVYS